MTPVAAMHRDGDVVTSSSRNVEKAVQDSPVGEGFKRSFGLCGGVLNCYGFWGIFEEGGGSLFSTHPAWSSMTIDCSISLFLFCWGENRPFF